MPGKMGGTDAGFSTCLGRVRSTAVPDGALGASPLGTEHSLSPLANHSFKKIEFQPPEAKKFFSTVRKEMALLATSLPDGIMVKTFEDRMASSLAWAGAGGPCGHSQPCP